MGRPIIQRYCNITEMTMKTLQAIMPMSTFRVTWITLLLSYLFIQKYLFFKMRISHGYHIQMDRTKLSAMESDHKFMTGVSIANHQHFFINSQLNSDSKKHVNYHGLPITTKPFNASYKNPCWFTNDNFFCLPYFFLGGFPKCGTSELYSQLIQHPHIAEAGWKEPHWWTRTRFAERPAQRYREYVSPAANEIKTNPEIITLDASASTIWDNNYLFPEFGDTSTPDPSMLVPHYIHLQLPHAKCIVILRDPVNRLYSGYLWFNFLYNSTKSPVDFHTAVKDAIRRFNDCLTNPKLSLLHCVYARLPQSDLLRRLRIGLYHIHLQTWITAFPADELMIVRLEDYSQNTDKVLQDIFHFLDVKQIQMENFEMNKKTNSKQLHQHENDNAKAYNRTGDMLDETRELLADFYRPYNRKLVELLKTKRFLFNDT